MDRKSPYYRLAHPGRSLASPKQSSSDRRSPWYSHILTPQTFIRVLPVLVIMLAIDIFIHSVQGSVSYETKRLNEARSTAQRTLEQSRLAGFSTTSLRVALATPAPGWPQIAALLLIGNAADTPWEHQRALLRQESAALQPALDQWQQQMHTITQERTTVIDLLRQLGTQLPQLSPAIHQRRTSLSLYGAVPLRQTAAAIQRLQQTVAWAQRYLSITQQDHALIAHAHRLIQQAEPLHVPTASIVEAVNHAQHTLATTTSLSSLQSLAPQLQNAVTPEQQAVALAAVTEVEQAHRTTTALYRLLQPSLPEAAQQVEQHLIQLPPPKQSAITTDEAIATQLDILNRHMQQLLQAEHQLHTTLEYAQFLGQQAARLDLPANKLEQAIASARLHRRHATTVTTIQTINSQLQSATVASATTVRQAAQHQLEHDRQQTVALFEQLHQQMSQLAKNIQQRLAKLNLKGQVHLSQEQANHTAFQAALSWATSLIATHQSAEAELHRAQLLTQKATQLHLPLGSVPQDISTFQQATGKATTAQALSQATASLKNATEILHVQVLAAAPGPGKVIVVRLQQQSLTAYDNGKRILTTPVTTGRKHLRTPIGIDTITWHASPYLFISPWPRTSPFWYPRSWVTWVMHFHSHGYFIHDAPWEPDSAFGPGSENGPYSSHGCIQVPHAAMQFLYSWTPNGTSVIVAP